MYVAQSFAARRKKKKTSVSTTSVKPAMLQALLCPPLKINIGLLVVGTTYVKNLSVTPVYISSVVTFFLLVGLAFLFNLLTLAY